MHARLFDYFICFYFVKIHIFILKQILFILATFSVILNSKSVAKHKYI